MSFYSSADARLKIEAAPPIAAEEILLASRDLGDGTRQTDLSVPGIRCGGCMAAVEKTLKALDGVASARVNLSTKRVAVRWQPIGGAPPNLVGALERIGYPAHLFSFENDAKDPELSRLLKVAGGGGLLRHEHHAVVRIRLVWSRRRNTAGVSSRFGLAGVSCHSLFRKDLLSLGMVGVAPRPHEHGRADLNRCDASLRP